MDVTDSLETLKVFQRVSKGFKAIVDDPQFLQFLLVKFKGHAFSADIYKDTPKKFLLLDRDVMRVFRTVIDKDKKSKKSFLRSINSIAFENLDLRLFLIKTGSGFAYYRLPKKQIDALLAVDAMDQKKWQKCIHSIVTSFIEHKHGQLTFEGPYVKKIEAGFLSPNKEMKKLIKEYKLEDVFIVEPSCLVIHGPKQEKIQFDAIAKATLDKKEWEVVSTFVLICQFVKELSLDVINDKFCYSQKEGIWPEVKVKLDKLNTEQKTILDQALPDEYKFHLGKLFPEIWPKIQDDEKCKKAINLLLINVFAERMRVICTEGMVEANLTVDLVFRNAILKRLKDPSQNLKATMEVSCSEGYLSLLKNIIFCEIWDLPPFDNKQGYMTKWNGDLVKMHYEG